MTKLYWDGPYAIALRLIEAHPGVNLKDVSLQKIYEWTVALPEFADDPALANEELLSAIYQEWFEEVNPL
ncbi:MAG: Fe-S cluster assembly protein IscX [Chloroflexota bacterium]